MDNSKSLLAGELQPDQSHTSGNSSVSVPETDEAGDKPAFKPRHTVPQQEPTPEEKARRASAMQTQGRKGCKAVRINMAFSPENHEFIKTLAAATGQNMTQFLNYIVMRYRTEHPELMEQAHKLQEILKDWSDESNGL